MRLYEHRKTVLAKEKCKRQKGKESTSKGGRRCVCTSKGNGKGEGEGAKTKQRAKAKMETKAKSRVQEGNKTKQNN